MLELQNICKKFQGLTLGPVNLNIAPGMAYGLLGPNGAGKTTLLNCIALQLRLTSGNIIFNGSQIGWNDIAWKSQISFIREVPNLYDELTIGQTLDLASNIYAAWDSSFADAMIRRFDLNVAERVGILSKGTKVKVGLIAALAHQAKVIILDEPTAGLDPSARAELQTILLEIKQARQDVSFIISSHIFEDTERVADELIILDRGVSHLLLHLKG
jgi:ABC-2 type transport system ATP-binding protein